MLLPHVLLSQQEPKTNLGMGGMKIFALFFRVTSRLQRDLTCSMRISSGVYTESPRRCQPPFPGNLTDKDNVLSTCLKRTLVLPKRSNTMTDSELRLADWILLTSEARDFELRCQFFSVRLVTTIPLAFMCGMILDMWLESKTMRLREGGGCLCLSRQPLRPHWRPFRQ